MEAKLRKTRWGGNEIKLIKTWMPSEEGDLAIRFATHFGIVAAKTEGVDAAGRAKLELQTVEEIVERSCSLAEKLVAKLKEKGWTVELPDLPDDDELVPGESLRKAKPDEGAPPEPKKE